MLARKLRLQHRHLLPQVLDLRRGLLRKGRCTAFKKLLPPAIEHIRVQLMLPA
jgi:hypothetical protein